MKPSFVCLALGILIVAGRPAPAPAAAEWLTDLTKAQARAKSDKKAVLINFTGSDWCGWCIRLRKEIFTRPEFEQYAASNLVLVEIDFPKRKEQPDTLKKANRALAQKFDVEGYPTLLILDEDGKKLGKLGYMPGGPKPFLKALDGSVRQRTASGLPVNARTPSPAPAAKPDATPTKKNTPAPWPPTQTEGLVVKGISGPKDRRMALINNQTFSPGEAASVKVTGGTLRVHCVAIRNDIVVVTIDGKEGQHELKLWNGL